MTFKLLSIRETAYNEKGDIGFLSEFVLDTGMKGNKEYKAANLNFITELRPTDLKVMGHYDVNVIERSFKLLSNKDKSKKLNGKDKHGLPSASLPV